MCFLGCVLEFSFPFDVPFHASWSGGKVGLNGIVTMTSASSLLKIVWIRLEFHPRSLGSISINIVESSGITLGGDCAE